MSRASRAHVLAVCCGLALATATLVATRQPRPSCAGCVEARYWLVPADAWKDTSGTPQVFPESAALNEERPMDFGVAFSGGGTRSASATLGQLRALRALGWLPHLRYMTAVSGGAWAAVPAIYAPEPLDQIDVLIGASQPPGAMDGDTLETPRGVIAGAIVRSKLAAAGLVEAAHLRRQTLLSETTNALVDLVRRRRTGPGMAGNDKMFARLLGDIFLKPVMPSGAEGRYFSWRHGTVRDITARTGLGADYFNRYGDKPFLITGGSIIQSHPAFDYPALVPVEYTPLYAGARQQAGSHVGGSYVWSWAYGAQPRGVADKDYVLVKPDDTHRFTLADMIASTGAAPQLQLFLGKGPARVRAAMQQAAGVFPYFHHFTVRDGVVHGSSESLPHGDGGFTDNLGVMPLLARGVKNIIVFVNSSSPFDVNTQLQSYFQRVDSRTGTGDRSLNQVFDSKLWDGIIEEYERDRHNGDAVVACRTGWTVLPNERYNIAGYGGLNICWVYNHDAAKWRGAMPAALRDQLWPSDAAVLAARTSGKKVKLTKRQKEFDSFPWLATFGENKPYVIKLNPAQVNVLANLSEWAVVSSESEIRQTFSRLALPSRR